MTGGRHSIPGATTVDLRPSYDAVIVGAGIQGLALAFELARRGMTRIAVMDRSWPGSGASSRNGEMIRSAFASPEWIAFFEVSLRRWHTLAADLDFNVLFTPAGYIVLASTPAELASLRAAAEAQRAAGLRTQLLDPRGVLELAPALNPALVFGGIYQPDGGFAHHDAVVWGYAQAAARLGVEIHPYTQVTGVTVLDGEVRGVATDRGSVATPVVVDAAGAESRALAALAGVDVPVETYRLEMIVCESLSPFLRPAVSSPHIMGYCHQTTRGEFVGGTEPAHPVPCHSLDVSLAGLRDMAAKFTQLLPVLRGARVLRQWAGLVSQAADLAPVLGAVPEVRGFFVDCGWVYGFMGAPAAGVLLAELIAAGRLSPVLAPFGIERLREGRLIGETSLVVSPGEDQEAAP